VTRRDRWAILYASLIFGVISTPYLYLGVYAAQGFFFSFEYAEVFWLPLSTALLLGVFIARTRLEQRLAATLGWLFPVLLGLVMAAAVGDVMSVTLLMMVQLLPTPAAAWTGAISVTAIAAIIVAAVVMARPPSRLEQAIALRLGGGNPRHRIYRAAGYVALLGGLVFASYWFRQDYIYNRYCVGYIEPQDYIDCQFRH
jgi:hypothetical protein